MIDPINMNEGDKSYDMFNHIWFSDEILLIMSVCNHIWFVDFIISKWINHMWLYLCIEQRLNHMWSQSIKTVYYLFFMTWNNHIWFSYNTSICTFQKPMNSSEKLKKQLLKNLQKQQQENQLM